MKYPSIRPLFVFSLILGLSLLAILVVGISRADAKVALDDSPVGIDLPFGVPATVYVVGSPSVLQQTPISFPTLSPTPTLVIEPIGTVTPFGLSAIDSGQELQAFIHAPSGLVPQPYVILTASEPVPGVGVEIRGYENLREFVCTDSPCALPLVGSSTVRFSSYGINGQKGPEVIAHVRVELKNGGYLVIIDSVSQFFLYKDSCSSIWNVKDESGEAWSRFPESPFQLNTDKVQHLLVTRLILNHIVDAQDCPAGGLGPGRDYPTGCGIERANTKMIEWQNQYDFKIWSSGLDVGIPPRILKIMIEYESQYWPSNERFFVDEIGLGQVNQLGIDALLRHNPDYYNKVCPSVYSDCSLPYVSLEPSQQAVVRGAILNSIDANCPSCMYGIDLAKANQSIPLIAQLLRANCQMVDSLNLQGKADVEYDDLWKYTLAVYHSGYSCVRDAVREARNNNDSLDWDTVAKYVGCKGTQRYVDGFWGSLISFDAYLLDAESVNLLQVAPTFLPTQTPIPLPTSIPSEAQVRVRVYLDANGNGSPETIEFLDGLDVQLLLRNGVVLSGVTADGQVVFDMTGYPPGMDGIVSLPGLYREQLISLPKEGVVQVDFVFTAPDIPNELP